MTDSLRKAIHEVADLAINPTGYADDGAESDRRAVLRDKLEIAITQTVANFAAKGE